MAIETATVEAAPPALAPSSLRRIIVAASLGTLFEWYDFYLYGSLAVFFGGLFFPHGNDTAQLLASLATFGAGFGVRPLGAIVFGHVGDLIGRKYTFMVTMAAMGLGTALIGVLPTYDRWGLGATVLLVALRLLQGLALGGEYGGAATYVAEHVPDEKRGYYTSYIQTTATLGFFLSMGIIGTTRASIGEAGFKEWGWRVPFLLSFVLLALSLYIRVSMKESPLFTKMKSAGKQSKNPIKESFANPLNLRYVLLALFGATAGQGVVWYTGQFYALFYMTTVLKMPYVTVYVLMMIVLTLGAPFFIVFGALSDRIGRRNIMTLGFALAVISYWPVFTWMGQVKDNPFLVGILVFYMIILVTMVYGPIAAFLVELFPARIRYTSMSLPYHVGNGVFGGLVPLAGATIATAFGGPLYGLFYPIGIAALGVVVSVAGLPSRSEGTKIWDEVGGAPPLVPDQP